MSSAALLSNILTTHLLLTSSFIHHVHYSFISTPVFTVLLYTHHPIKYTLLATVLLPLQTSPALSHRPTHPLRPATHSYTTTLTHPSSSLASHRITPLPTHRSWCMCISPFTHYMQCRFSIRQLIPTPRHIRMPCITTNIQPLPSYIYTYTFTFLYLYFTTLIMPCGPCIFVSIFHLMHCITS